MKNLLFGLFLCLGTVFVVFSCKKDLPTNSTNNSTSQENHSTSGGFRERYILYLAWDKGRKVSESCVGRGICDPVFCMFCCVENGDIVDCETSLNIPYAGGVTETNGVYELVFTLDPANAEHEYDIAHEIELKIEEDIQIGDDVNGYYTIKSGVYPFDPEVGAHGGYLIGMNNFW